MASGRKRMFGNGNGTGGWMFFGLLMMVGVVLLVVVVARAIGGGVRRGGTAEPTRSQGRSEPQARRLLDERYARGELTTDEYQERLRALGQS